MTRSLGRWPTKAKEAPSPHEVRLATLDTNPVLQCIRENFMNFELEAIHSDCLLAKNIETKCCPLSKNSKNHHGRLKKVKKHTLKTIY